MQQMFCSMLPDEVERDRLAFALMWGLGVISSVKADGSNSY